MARWLFLLCFGCQDLKELGGGAGLDLTWIPGVGVVYECDTGEVTHELCWQHDAESLEASLADSDIQGAYCYPTPRHLGPCIWRCDGGKGCNAFSGCWGCP